MSTYRTFQLASSSFLLLNTIYLYLTQPDWWIYGLVSGSAGLLNLLNRNSCPYWRFAVSVVIVLGTLETIFLAWCLRLLEQTSSLGNHTEIFRQLPEGRNLLLVSCATFLTISARLKSAEHHQFLDYIRTLIIITLLVVVVATIGYSALFFVPSLADFVTHSIAI